MMDFSPITAALDVSDVVLALFQIASIVATFYVARSGIKAVIKALYFDQAAGSLTSTGMFDKDGDEMLGNHWDDNGKEWIVTTGGMKPKN